MSSPVAGYPTAPQQGQPVRDQYGNIVQQAPQGWQPPPVQQQQGQPQLPQQVQQQLQNGQLDMNARVSGPGIPQELQGRTLGEVFRFYGVMREDFLARADREKQGFQQPQQQGQPQQQTPGSPQYRPPQQQYAPQQQQPQQISEDVIRRVAVEAVAPYLQPMQQATAAQVESQVRARFPDWNNFDQAIRQQLQGASSEQLLQPGLWEAAYYLAKGRAASNPQQFQGQPQYQQQGVPVQNYQQPPQQYYQQPQQGYQPPQQQGFGFVESPTPSAPTPGTNGGANSVGPHDEVMARRWNLPVEEFRAWKGGNVPPVGAQVQTQNQMQYPQQQPPQPPPYGYPMTQTPNGGYYGR